MYNKNIQKFNNTSESDNWTQWALGKIDNSVYQVTLVIVVVHLLYYITVAKIYHSVLHHPGASTLPSEGQYQQEEI